MGVLSSKKTIASIFKVALSNLIKLLSGVLVGFLLPKIIGVTDYGYYKTFTLYATYVALFHFGFIDGIYLVYSGKSYDVLDKKAFRLFSRFFFLMETIISIILCITAFFILEGELKFIFVCLSVYLLANNITGYFQLLSQVTGRFTELSIRNIIQSVLTILSIVILWVMHKFFKYEINYYMYTIIYIFILSLLCTWYIFTYRDIVFYEREKFINHKKEIVDFFKIGFPLLIANLSSTLILTVDRQFVNILFSTETYAIYAFAYNMLSLITTALSAISTVLYPVMKQNSFQSLKSVYNKLILWVLIIVFMCLNVYFPLCWFVEWFLPKYIDSLLIFRIILPGLASSSAITIIMHNYYKMLGKNGLFFLKSIFILVVSCIANIIAYLCFKNTISISIASVIVSIIWYVIIEVYFIRNYKIPWIKNFIYMICMMILFYIITCIELLYVSMILYLVSFVIVSLLFYYPEIKSLFIKK